MRGTSDLTRWRNERFYKVRGSLRPVTVLLAIVGLPVLVILVSCTKVSAEDVATTEHCAEDVAPDGYIDTSDISMLTGVFGQAGGTLDIAPELAPDGFVDTQDISLLTNHFGEGCIGSTGADSVVEMLEPSGVWDCTFKVSGFIWGPMGNYSLSHDWGGKTICRSDGGAYLSFCMFAWEWQDANGWHLVQSTPDYYFDGTYCIAQGYSAWLPHNTPLRGSIYHWLKRSNGSFTHSPMYHAEGVTHHIP